MLLKVILLLLAFALFIVYIDILNPGDVQITLPGDYLVEPSKIALMLGSAAFGALAVVLGIYIKSASDFFANWKSTRNKQKEAKVQAIYSKGLNAILSRRSDLAAASFEKALSIKPDHTDSLLRLGNILRKDGDYVAAAKLHNRARTSAPDNIEVLFALALDYEYAHRTEDSLQLLDDILGKDPGNLRALTKMRDLHLKQGDFEKAEQTQERILKLSLPAKEREAEAGRLLGLKYETGREALEKNNLETAKRVFKAIIKANKDFVPAYIGLGEVYISEGDSPAAASLWEDGYKTTRSIIFMHRLEDLYMELGNPGKMINLYKEALQRSPRDINLNFFMGKLYYRLEMVDDAFETLSALDNPAMRMPELHKLLGNLYVRRGSFEQAVDEFNRSLAIGDRIIVPYRCGNCEHFSTEWSGRCPRCGKWNTFGVDLDTYC